MCVLRVWGECVHVRVCERACLSPCLWWMFSHQAAGKTPPLLASHGAAFSHWRESGVSQHCFSGVRIDVPWWPSRQKKTWRGERHSASGRSLCFRKIRHSLNDGEKSRSVYFHIHLMWKNSRNGPKEGFCIGLIKGMWFGIRRLSQTLREWPYSNLLVLQFTNKRAE